MDYSFSHYLLAKQSVDDRALNRYVYSKLVESLPSEPLRIIEVGAGIGTMLARLLRWGLFEKAEYVLVDEMSENIEYAAGWLAGWAAENGLQVDIPGLNKLHLYDGRREILVSLVCADVFDFIHSQPPSADLLIAHAFLDLLNMPAGLRELFNLLKPGGLAWLTINFDGVTTFEPGLQPELDREIERLYHQSMDTRPTGGDSQAGRHLFGHLSSLDAQIMAAGASDWVVHAQTGHYPQDEAYFLNFILYFFELSLQGHPGLESEIFKAWLAGRRAQLERAELVYIAHQMDFLVKPAGA